MGEARNEGVDVQLGIFNCFVDITGGGIDECNYFGGLVGFGEYMELASNCYFKSRICTPQYVNGAATIAPAELINANNPSMIDVKSNCKYDYNVALTSIINDYQGVRVPNLNLKSASTFAGWDTNVWTITDGSYPELNMANLANGTTPNEPTTTVDVSFKLDFSSTTPKGGAVLYILCPDSRGGYLETRQYYFDGQTTSRTITYTLTRGATYKLILTKPYVWDFNATSGITLTKDNNNYTFTALSTGTITMATTGGTPPNTFIVV